MRLVAGFNFPRSEGDEVKVSFQEGVIVGRYRMKGRFGKVDFVCWFGCRSSALLQMIRS